ncbi:ABC transporter permease [Proteiniphilum sp.]|uniref:ABC transporter permease n=1 Tax=Proteiniphilum sp. TaxID=1926877 RepID=UPI002B2215C8|nr:ABC transporter permease [Proteiniphilum sp.]MEA4916764.1 ABC transporter permease [Proteiniphilum sp.]
MKTVFRNLSFVLKRFSVASMLNIIGLSVAFAAFIVIMIQVDFENRFDHCHPNAERIFRVDLVRDGNPYGILPRAFADAVIASSPHISEGTIITPINEWSGNFYITVGKGAESNGFKEPFQTCYPSITKIFGFQFTEGDPDCLKDPEKIIIPKSMSQRLFGNETAIGKQVHLQENLWTKDSMKDLTVGGIYEDFPDNTQIKNVIYTRIDNTQSNDWYSSNYLCYLLFNDKQEAGQFETDFNNKFDFSVLNLTEKTDIRLLPLTDIYFSKTGFRSGNANTVRILFAIALLIIIIASINYINFSIAMTPMRIRSLNTKKILGSSVGRLRISLISEAVIIALMAWTLSLMWVFILTEYNLLPFFEADLHPLKHIPLVLLTALIVLSAGLISGLYPAFYSTSFQPALVLKGNFGVLPAGRKLRIALIGFQYVTSIVLIIAAIFIQKQNLYLRHFDQGFDKEQIAVVKLNRDLYQNSRDSYVNELKSYSGIEDVAFSKQTLGASDGYTSYGLKYKDKEVFGYTLEVSDNFLDVMNIAVPEGRSFLPSDVTSGNLTFVVNRSFQQRTGISAGETIEMVSWDMPNCNVIGITGDVKFTSLRRGNDDILFLVGSRAPLPVSYIRIKAGTSIPEAVKHIRKTVTDIDPTFPLEVEFYDEILANLYQKEEHLNKNISLLSLLAILISVVGIFGLVMFDTQYRRKEIVLRKVFGSSTREILLFFNKAYLLILGVCFLLAVPAAYYAIDRWMENFAFKTPLSWWGFALAGVVVLLLTVTIVSVQSYRAAISNPVESLKTE